MLSNSRVRPPSPPTASLLNQCRLVASLAHGNLAPFIQMPRPVFSFPGTVITLLFSQSTSFRSSSLPTAFLLNQCRLVAPSPHGNLASFTQIPRPVFPFLGTVTTVLYLLNFVLVRVMRTEQQIGITFIGCRFFFFFTGKQVFYGKFKASRAGFVTWIFFLLFFFINAKLVFRYMFHSQSAVWAT